MAKKDKSIGTVSTNVNLNDIKSVEELMKIVDARKTQLIVEGSKDFTDKLKAASESFATLSTEAKETIYKDKTIKGFLKVLKLSVRESPQKDGSTGGDKKERNLENLLTVLPYGKDKAIAVSNIAKSFKGGVNAVKEFVEQMAKDNKDNVRSVTKKILGKDVVCYYQHP